MVNSLGSVGVVCNAKGEKRLALAHPQPKPDRLFHRRKSCQPDSVETVTRSVHAGYVLFKTLDDKVEGLRQGTAL